jgi:dephospho-CoA kinase
VCVIGLTGGIASGKSVVTGMLREMGAKIIDADLIAREIVAPGQPAWQEIVAYFGKSVLREDNTINRTYLGSLVFGNHAARQALNNFTHPRVIAETRARIARWQQLKTRNIIVVDMPLLIETGFFRTVDEVWVVKVDERLQLERLCARDGFTWEEARQRVATQMPLAQKMQYAHRVIDNNGTLAETKRQIEVYWEQMQAQYRQTTGVEDGKNQAT